MKFGKEYVPQMVPEWQEAYMNYNFLKSLLEDIKRFKQLRKPAPTPPTGIRRSSTLYRAFSGLTRRRSSRGSPIQDLEEQVILVNPVKHEGGCGYQTEFLMSSDEGGEYELVFFRRLDDEFNKVIKFYKDKVDDVFEEAALLNKQMEALIALRITVDESVDWSVGLTKLRSDIASSSSSSDVEMDTLRTKGAHHMDVIEETEHSNQGTSEEIDTKYTEASSRDKIYEAKSSSIEGTRPTPLQILKNVKLNNTFETPRSTIKGVLQKSNNHKLNFRRKELTKVEEQLKKAFIEFYHKFRLLKSYSFLNLLAFSKIMKKYDKITSRKVSRLYLKMIDESPLGNSDEISRLMERVEVTFIKHFANGNRGKGIKILRPSPTKEKHLLSYFLGFFSGCMIALLVALILNARHVIGKPGSTLYMQTLFPLYSLFGFIVLHMLMYGANIYFWRRYRVNYSFIFGFKHGTGLGYREVFLVSTILGTLALASVLANLDVEMENNKNDYKKWTELVPLGLVCLVLGGLMCPFNIMYRSSRFFLLRCAFHGFCAPFYKVTLPDFLLADQLTSQVQALRSFEFYICYYGWEDFTRRENNCKKKPVYVTFSFIIASVPYWIRFLQCVRRFFEENDKMQGYNGLKYFSTIVAVCMRTALRQQPKSLQWQVMAWTFSVISAIVSTYWDLVIDWGLIQRRSKNRWLRDKLLVSHKSVYFVAIVLNVLLRFAWLQTVLHFEVEFLHPEALVTIVASLEIIRRGIWTFFRLENEHLNNVGNYRAFKTVPLPFNYDEEDDKYQ